MKMIRICALVVGLGVLSACSPSKFMRVKSMEAEPQRYSDGSAQFTQDFAQQYAAVLHFSLDGHQMDAQEQEGLNRIAQQLQEHPELRVYVDGYTCELGGSEYNMALGYRRAQAVSDYLIKLGVGPDQLVLLSYGKEKPVDERHVEAAWKKNRRVEVHLVQPMS